MNTRHVNTLVCGTYLLLRASLCHCTRHLKATVHTLSNVMKTDQENGVIADVEAADIQYT